MRGVVLDAVTLEARDRAIVQPDRNIDEEDALWALECFHQVRKLAQGGSSLGGRPQNDNTAILKGAGRDSIADKLISSGSV
jgi:hypothetical protein